MLMDVLDYGWVWLLAAAALYALAAGVVCHWPRVRRWRLVDALLVAVAIADHHFAGSSRHDLSTSIDPRPWSLDRQERLAWLFDVDNPDRYPKGA